MVQTSANETRYSFNAEYNNPDSGQVQRFQLTFFPEDQTAQMMCLKTKKEFLKRTKVSATMDNMAKGLSVNILSRQLKLVGYADNATEKALSSLKEKVGFLIKPDAYQNIGSILQQTRDAGLVPTKIQMVKLSADHARDWASSDEEAAHLCSDVAVAVEAVGDNAGGLLDRLVGDLRAQFGQDGYKNAVHVATDPEEVAEICKGYKPTALFNNCSTCVIRPHAMKQAGAIINDILKANFEISAMQQFSLNVVEAAKFLEVYKGVLPECPALIQEFTSGPCLVMEVRQENCVENFRELVGPHDPEIATHLRPSTLRAKYGLDRVQNALHCTDLPEDGQLEAEFFFIHCQDSQ